MGIDLEGDRLVALQAEVSPKGILIIGAEETILPPDVVSENRIKQPVMLADALRTLQKKAKLAHRKASINLPSRFYSIKTFTLPAGYFSTNPDALEWEVEQHLVGDIQDYRFDKIIAGKVARNEITLLVFAHESLIEERAGLLRDCGITPISVEPGIISIYNAYSFLAGDFLSKNALLLDIGYPFSSFGFIIENVLHPGISFPTPSDIAEGGSIDEFNQSLVEAFNAVFEIHGFSLSAQNVELILPGGVLANSEIVEEIARRLKTSVLPQEPFTSAKFKKKTEIDSFKLIKAFGLAMRTANG